MRGVPAWSVRTDLMSRTVCVRCDHMHRHVLRDACACCRADIKHVEALATETRNAPVAS